MSMAIKDKNIHYDNSLLHFDKVIQNSFIPCMGTNWKDGYELANTPYESLSHGPLTGTVAAS